MVISTITFIVPTFSESRPLRRCLDSIASQLGPKDEVIVALDTTDGPLPAVERLVGMYGGRYRCIAYAGDQHSYGHEQLNYAMTEAQGDFIGLQDDDDVWTPAAVATIRAGVQMAPDRPHLFRFRHYNGLTYWLQPGLWGRDLIGGHCLVTPNLPGKVGRFGMQYSGDFDYLESTMLLHGGVESAIWHPELIAIARPS